jgi:hypothetical protein
VAVLPPCLNRDDKLWGIDGAFAFFICVFTLQLVSISRSVREDQPVAERQASEEEEDDSEEEHSEPLLQRVFQL